MFNSFKMDLFEEKKKKGPPILYMMKPSLKFEQLDCYYHLEKTTFYKIGDNKVLFKLQFQINKHLKVYAEWLPGSQTRNKENLTLEEQDSLYYYTTHNFKKINMKLLSGNTEYDKKVHGINQAIIHAYQLDLPSKCYRIANLDAFQYYSYKEGSVSYTLSFASTSRTVLQWSGNTLFIINLVKGKRLYACDVAKYSQYPEESEILLALNSPLKLIEKGSKRSGFSRIKTPLDERWKRNYEFIIVLELLK